MDLFFGLMTRLTIVFIVMTRLSDEAEVNRGLDSVITEDRKARIVTAGVLTPLPWPSAQPGSCSILAPLIIPRLHFPHLFTLTPNVWLSEPPPPPPHTHRHTHYVKGIEHLEKRYVM